MAMNFKDEIEQGLKKLSRRQQVDFAWRCGLKALPFLGAAGAFAYWPESKRQIHFYRVFRALDIVAADAGAASAASVADDAYASARAAASSAYAAADAAYAAADAAYASAAASSADAADAYAYADVAAAASTSASASARAARAASNVGVDLVPNILADLRGMQQGQEQPSMDAGIYGDVWPNFLQALDAEGCAYWGEVLQDLFASGFQIDKAVLARRLSVPGEIQAQGAAAVASYLQKLEKGARRLNEARIIILGDKGAGKTSIARKLVDPEAPLPEPEESTAGVDTLSWDLPDQDFNVRIWDFAGHTVTHAVHQFFLSERCLYILVCNGRSEEYKRLEYWLEQMQIYGGRSEVMLFVNKKDPHPHSIAINKLRSKYSIIKLYEFSLAEAQDEDQLLTFRREVMDYILQNPSWKKQKIPKEHYQVKERLESLFETGDAETGEECIERSRFDAIAEEFAVQDKEGLLKDLHALGVSLWYPEIAGVQTLVLNPEWISHGIYRIINWVHQQKRHGLSLGQFQAVFEQQAQRYPLKEQAFLFELMKHYELAFEAEKDHERYLVIPHLLGGDQPNRQDLPTFAVGDSLQLRYRAEVDLPPHTISRFIVRHHNEIRQYDGEAQVWKEGVVLEQQQEARVQQRTLALVELDERTLSVSVRGANKTDYLDRLRETLNDLFEEFKKLKPELEYRVQRFGEIPDDVEENNPLWLAERRIASLSEKKRPHWDEITGQDIPLDRSMKQYNIRIDNINIGNLIQGGVGGSFVAGDQNNFSFENCNIDLQGSLNELAQLAKEKGQKEQAQELQNLAAALEDAEACQSPREVKKKGIVQRLRRFTEELADEKSELHTLIKGVKNGTKIAQGIVGRCNELAEWCGLPQVL